MQAVTVAVAVMLAAGVPLFHVGAFADDAVDESFVFEDGERFFGGDVGDAVFLAECLDAGYTAGEGAVVDLGPQQRR